MELLTPWFAQPKEDKAGAGEMRSVQEQSTGTERVENKWG